VSVLTLDGRRFAAGLVWLERAGPARTTINARKFGRPYRVHWRRQTGYAAEAGEPDGCPSLAAALHAHIDSPFWMALVEADDGRLALVKVRDGAILADGDEVFEDRAQALEAFERARPLGWALFATPGLVDGPAETIDLSALPTESDMRLASAPFARLTGKAAGLLLLVVAVAGAPALWLHHESIWALIAGPEPVVEKIEAAVAPPVAVAVDSATLIAACRRALMAHPPYLPAWKTGGVTCVARFSETTLVALRPELEGRAVLLARWRLMPGRSEVFHRRIAEEHLARWYAASVTGARAWGVVPLDPVIRESSAVSPSFLAFRREVDRRLGGPDARIEYTPPGGRSRDGVEVRISTRQPLTPLTEAIGGVPGLEILRLSRGAGGEWRLEGRRIAPVELPQARFEQPELEP